MSVVALTGVSGGLGRNLLMQLEVDPEVSRIVGLDVAPPPPIEARKLVFVHHDVTEPFAHLFAEQQVDAAVHLAWGPGEAAPEGGDPADVVGARNFLSACGAAGVRSVCMVSSGTVYGSGQAGGLAFEASPLRASRSFPYGWSRLRVEELCFDFAKDHPDVCLQIVRPCAVVGPSCDGWISRLLAGPVLFGPWRGDPKLQLVHEDDATRAIYRLLRQEQIGVFNLASEGALTLTQVAQLGERRLVRLPAPALRALAWLARRLRLGWLGALPPGWVDAWLDPGLLAPTKLRTEAYFTPRFDAAAAFLDLLERRGTGGVGAAPVGISGIEESDDEVVPLPEPIEELELEEAVDAPPPAGPGDLAAAELAPADPREDALDPAREPATAPPPAAGG